MAARPNHRDDRSLTQGLGRALALAGVALSVMRCGAGDGGAPPAPLGASGGMTGGVGGGMTGGVGGGMTGGVGGMTGGVGGGMTGGVGGGMTGGVGGASGTGGGAGGEVTGGAGGGTSGGAPGRDELSPAFRGWLDAHGYGADDFARDSLVGGAFGGCESLSDLPQREPVVFVHGNSDRAHGGPMHGFAAARDHLLANGYRPCELYATTWGPADASQAAQQDHARLNVLRVRRFLDAVLAYTGAPRVDVVAHSMGVTLARLAVQGGQADDQSGAYEVGAPLSQRIDAFIGIAGANRGLTACYSAPSAPTCGKVAGLYPGTAAGTIVSGRSKLLDTLDAAPHDEGARVHTIWSPADEVIGFGGIVWGAPTSKIAGEDADHELPGLKHLELKDETVGLQLTLLGP